MATGHRYAFFLKSLLAIISLSAVTFSPPSVAQGSTGRDDAIAQATRLAIQTTGTAKKIPSAACLRALSRGKKVPKKCPHGGNSSGIAKGDFNGDGFADLAIGMPSKDESRTIKNSGAVAVIYGSANGLTAPATAGAVPLAQVWTQNSPGVPGDSESNDFFGATLASGDFNGDNFSDLAIGAPLERACVNRVAADDGSVTVIFGSALGLTTDISTGVPASQFLTTRNIDRAGNFFDRGIPLACATQDDVPLKFRFGDALTWGDFNGDGIGDLAIGAPTAPLKTAFGKASTGAVFVFFGSATGLDLQRDNFIFPIRPQLLENVVEGFEAVVEDGEDFGSVLAAGDFNGDGQADLAVSAPLKDFGRNVVNSGVKDAGAVIVYTSDGDGRGLKSNPQSVFTKGRGGAGSQQLGGSPKPGDQFGRALAAGDFDGDGRADLAIGTPFEDVGSNTHAGAVDVVLSHSSSQLGIRDAQFLTQDRIFATPDIPSGGTEAGDSFGRALAAGDFNGDGRADLAIGVPFEDLPIQQTTGRFKNIVNAGEVDVVYGNKTGLGGGRAPQRWSQNTTDVEDEPEAGDNFGLTLSAWNFGRNETRLVGTAPIQLPITLRTADLAIGVGSEDLGTITDAGGINVLYGNVQSENGLSATGNQFWTQDSPGVPGTSQASDFFGNALY